MLGVPRTHTVRRTGLATSWLSVRARLTLARAVRPWAWRARPESAPGEGDTARGQPFRAEPPNRRDRSPATARSEGDSRYRGRHRCRPPIRVGHPPARARPP